MFWWLLIMLVAVPGMMDAGSLPSAGHVSFTQPGNVTLGAMFPMLKWTSGPPCSGDPHPWGSEMVALFMYSVEMINRRRDLLPDVTIGFDIRNDCYSETMSLWSALALASTGEKPQEDIEFKKVSSSDDTGRLMCIIGTESSSTSIMAAFSASLYRIPVISPFATSNELSIKSRFPYFLRTVPPDNLQATAIVDILLRFGWKYIGLYFHLNSYGIHGAHALLDLAEKHDICVAFSVPVRPEAPKEEIDELVLNMVNFPKAKVVVMFVFTEAAGAVLRSVDELADLRNVTFIASDGWVDQRGLYLQGVNFDLLKGSVFISLYSCKIPGFPEYYRSLQLKEEPFSPWFRDLKEGWLASQDCLNLADCPGLQTFDNDDTLTDAVSAFAYALQDLINDKCTNGIDCNSLLQNITGYDLHPYLLSVKFEGICSNYSFDENGNPGGAYKISVFQELDGEFNLFRVGGWIGSSANPLQIDTTDVVWPGGSPDPAVSLCRDTCQAGFVEVPLEQKCCSGCQKCPNDAIVKDSSCEACPDYEWPDTNFLKCTPIEPTPTDLGEPIVMVIVVLSGFGLILSGLASVGLFYYRQNVLIKAASRELSSINIFGLSLAFLSPFLLLVPPTDVSCRALDFVISVCFGLTYAPTLLKVNRIYRIFDAGKKSNKCPRFIGSGHQLIMVSSIVAVTVIISIVGTFVDPTKPAKLRFFPPTNYIEAYCKFGYGFLASIVYNLLLILACCYYAFKARRVPSNYNESRFIALSVYSTLVFGMAAVPVYITAQYTLQKVATFCVAILLNSFLTLFCVYLPKLYAILLAKDVELCEWRANTASTDVGTATSAASRRGTAQVHPAPEDVKQVTDQQVKES